MAKPKKFRPAIGKRLKTVLAIVFALDLGAPDRGAHDCVRFGALAKHLQPTQSSGGSSGLGDLLGRNFDVHFWYRIDPRRPGRVSIGSHQRRLAFGGVLGPRGGPADGLLDVCLAPTCGTTHQMENWS